MAAIKPIEQSSGKWVRRATVAGPDYTAGIQSPRTPWMAATVAADPNYRSGVTAAANAGRYAAGARAAGDQKWQSKAIQKGPGRFAEGVALAENDWQAGFAPYHQAIAALSLPARGPRRSPQNLQRVSAVTTALGQLRERRGAGRT